MPCVRQHHLLFWIDDSPLRFFFSFDYRILTYFPETQRGSLVLDVVEVEHTEPPAEEK